MKKLIALAALAPFAVAVAALPASAQDTVVVKRHEGMHHHYGHSKKVIIKKHHGHTTKIIKHSED